ncbi:MAG: DUF3617 family protein [Bdellovibrionaceae bacterium]|nr:DUF3617 family protein [Pseudobdellovibrionaceae bacterium]
MRNNNASPCLLHIPLSSLLPLLLLGMVLCFPFLANAQTITAGLWKANTELSVNGIALPNIPVEDCISTKEAKDIRKYLQENLMPETSCKITNWDYAKPMLKASLSCDGKQGKSQGKLSGKVTEKSFDITGNLSGEHVLMGSVDIAIKYKGDYQKDCKPAP